MKLNYQQKVVLAVANLLKNKSFSIEGLAYTCYGDNIGSMIVNISQSNESNSKIIILLQKLKTEVWNISFFTLSFNLINIKIDAKTKKILEKSNTPLIQF